ncbi:hypothetical protein GobsT_07610 [Gemmata obscuriglobus]|uniref:Uma2 family endonuclease n=1 Tax=Gemmata obscuriglobus TaxID=114 RepID=A0A2Z3HCM7_9BACT|nr:Uma2 family endonuclease [Gemmata obscuriglobus]AWM40705.1 Uma2 family endonuclease [Gemmata obscuriglobus]QEG26026.1 hypothetical protein GobsT_07610 [Gemmata obscuriglobus]VTS00361.1 Uncharacterized protein OS=Cylindrospermum stagnale PCC 7417 GN=Cylst_2512 PE=4 SV=1: Uma2 [Gemmata obscuriglobus UQM 2246]
MSTPVLPAHRVQAATAQRMTENWLRNVFAPNLYTVHWHDGTDASAPDVSVVRVHPATDAERVPVLVVEIEDADAGYDLAEQASRHAAAGVLDYWVIDVVARQLHIFRDPRPDPAAQHGFSYNSVRLCSPNALVSPLVAELHLAQVVDLLP